MTSARQIEANRRNALGSTGPKTDLGKQRASQNAVRHGLTAETVIIPIEDPADYQAFELAVTADYEAETAVERELVLRLASLLWRLRRATSIETGLLQIQDEIAQEPGRASQTQLCQNRAVTSVVLFGELTHDQTADAGDRCDHDPMHAERPTPTSSVRDFQLDAARRFLNLADLDNGVFERLGRYEAALWRQVRQTIFTLEALRWRPSNSRKWHTQHSRQRSDW
jgi:hypothetical protein